MMNRFHWSMVSLGIIAFAWWTFFANVPAQEELSTYPREHYLEDMSKIYCDMGQAALKRGDLSKAIKSYQETVAMRPTWLEGYDRLGTAYELNNQPQEALNVYTQAMAVNPLFLEYRQYANNRNKLPKRQLFAKPTKAIEWTGQDLTNKKIFIYAEKSLADTILYARFLPLLAAKAGQVYFKPQEQLLQVIRQSKLGIKLCNNQTNLEEINADFEASLLTIQHYLNVPLKEINRHKAYLKIHPDKIETLNKFSFDTTDLKVGIAWQNQTYKADINTIKITPSFFAPLCHIPGVKIYLLQTNTAKNQVTLLNEDNVVDMSGELKNFRDIAAAISNLDVLITADTTYACLAGALDKKTWYLIPSLNDWRWFNYWDKNNTIWFDDFKKIHQAPNKSWQQALSIIKSKILKLLATRATSPKKTQ